MLERKRVRMNRANRFAAYPHEFKVEAVRLVKESGLSISKIAEDLGVSTVSLNRWLKNPELTGEATGSTLDADERAELRKLRREVKVLREEREILKKAAVFFAEETRNRK